MKASPSTPSDYLLSVDEARRPAMSRLRETISGALPAGFLETMSYGMIGWVVPHELYAPGYHCDPKLPLPFASIAAQKNHIAVYHMGLYAYPARLEAFVKHYEDDHKAKLDVGKSCLRFKKPEHIPFELLAELFGEMSPADWIETYEREYKR